MRTRPPGDGAGHPGGTGGAWSARGACTGGGVTVSQCGSDSAGGCTCMSHRPSSCDISFHKRHTCSARSMQCRGRCRMTSRARSRGKALMMSKEGGGGREVIWWRGWVGTAALLPGRCVKVSLGCAAQVPLLKAHRRCYHHHLRRIHHHQPLPHAAPPPAAFAPCCTPLPLLHRRRRMRRRSSKFRGIR